MNFWQKYNSVKISQNEGNGQDRRTLLWPIGVCLGGLFLVIGGYGEQLTDMYRKAVMICLECIGIG